MRPRGRCPVCGWTGALTKDGTLYRHYAGLFDADLKGVCKGWKQRPVT